MKKTLWEQITSICEGVEESAQTDRAQNDLMNAYLDAYNRNEKLYDKDGNAVLDSDGNHISFQDRMNTVGSHIGINNPNSPQKQAQVNALAQRGETGDVEFIRMFVDKLVDAAEQLQPYITNTGKINANLLFAHNLDQYGLKTKPVENADYLMKMKDVIDLLSLNFLCQQNYDTKTTPASNKELAEIALEKKANSTDPKVIHKFITDYLLSDQIAIEKEMGGTTWSNDSGTGYRDRYAVWYYTKLKKKPTPKQKSVADSNIVEEVPQNPTPNSPKYINCNGVYYGLTYTSKQEIFAQHKEEILSNYAKKLADKMFNQVYGLDVEVPKTPFTYGNNKLYEDTLVINFTSAHRCPAWNECLVGHACYARQSEHGYHKSLFPKNKNLNMMWEGSRYDTQILNALKTLIRSYIINFTNIAPVFTNQTLGYVNEAKQTQVPYEEQFYEIIKKPEGFNLLTQEQCDIIKNTEGIIRTKYIRLNEEGDFIGQWLVDAMDEFGGELSKIGVSIAAYTCRGLNYNGIKNIIINASKAAIGTTNGKIANAITRRFYAVPEEFYNNLDETYASNLDEVAYDENGQPLYDTVPPTNVDGHIVPYPQPIYKDFEGEAPNGYYYYKCPCGRGSKDNKDSGLLAQRFNIYKYGDITKSGINCYDCRVCYQPKMEEISDKPIIVYVQVHSTEKEAFEYKEQPEAGYSKNYSTNDAEYQKWLKDNPQKEEAPKKQRKKKSKYDYLRENVEGKIDREKMAYEIIADNARRSVNDRLKEISRGQKMEEQVTSDFKSMLDRINNVKR